jgi:hypothetical protein
MLTSNALKHLAYKQVGQISKDIQYKTASKSAQDSQVLR